ncbi:MAG: hypothetical protein SGPRY_000547 [Prymnesium sp.]
MPLAAAETSPQQRLALAAEGRAALLSLPSERLARWASSQVECEEQVECGEEAMGYLRQVIPECLAWREHSEDVLHYLPQGLAQDAAVAQLRQAGGSIAAQEDVCGVVCVNYLAADSEEYVEWIVIPAEDKPRAVNEWWIGDIQWPTEEQFSLCSFRMERLSVPNPRRRGERAPDEPSDFCLTCIAEGTVSALCGAEAALMQHAPHEELVALLELGEEILLQSSGEGDVRWRGKSESLSNQPGSDERFASAAKPSLCMEAMGRLQRDGVRCPLPNAAASREESPSFTPLLQSELSASKRPRRVTDVDSAMSLHGGLLRGNETPHRYGTCASRKLSRMRGGAASCEGEEDIKDDEAAPQSRNHEAIQADEDPIDAGTEELTIGGQANHEWGECDLDGKRSTATSETSDAKRFRRSEGAGMGGFCGGMGAGQAVGMMCGGCGGMGCRCCGTSCGCREAGGEVHEYNVAVAELEETLANIRGVNAEVERHRDTLQFLARYLQELHRKSTQMQMQQQAQHMNMAQMGMQGHMMRGMPQMGAGFQGGGMWQSGSPDWGSRMMHDSSWQMGGPNHYETGMAGAPGELVMDIPNGPEVNFLIGSEDSITSMKRPAFKASPIS